ncbi:helix-turn-helix domain-containing protein [Oceanirhabdus sp. W0125-5]|uniref:helix-turn-helix domain-containing protein n=1 Tax=Oceanirhabdus sp. W0125-5 TaxID=2999116 RepID=UPI0022F2AD63|nr:helix-turn-helix transcriptional regulator [Oceanirhabdus sp. W0125-5]WBW98974.1 helix-turn-helix transcriptional regulator [Oceanirhabdus sp. W0125-5]
MDFTIITQGERVRDIRKRLKLKQEDLSGDIITRNLISMIETDKASLTPKAAEVIHDNLKSYIKERNITANINIDEIFITEEDQAKQIYENFLKYIEEVGVEAESLLSEMISIINKYELNYMKVYIYGNLARAFRVIRDINTACSYYQMAIEFVKMSSINCDYYGKLMTGLTHCQNRLGKFEDGIRVCDNIVIAIDKDYLKKIKYNKILMLKRSEKYSECLSEIQKFENDFQLGIDDVGLNINIKTIKANCYRAQGYFNKALKIYKETLEDIKECEEYLSNKILIMSNIMEVTTLLEDDYDEYLKQLVIEIENNRVKFEENYFAAEIYKWIAHSFENKKDEDSMKQAYEYTLKSLDLAVKFKNMDIIDYDLNKLIEYITQVEECTIEVVQKHILSLLQAKMIKSDSKVVMKLINFHMLNDNKEEAKKVVDFCKDEVS